MTVRLILESDQDNLRFALSAAQWLLRQPDSQKDAILAYAGEVSIYVRRNKGSISARQIPSANEQREST